MQVEQQWLEESSEEDEGVTGAQARQALADGDSAAQADSTGTDAVTAQTEHACASDTGTRVYQKAPQESKTAAEQHGDQCGDATDPDADHCSEDGEVDEAYVMAYLGRHMCPQEVQSADVSGGACGGTMTPVGVHGDTYVCNMCDFERSEQGRIAELARTFQEIGGEAE